MYQCIMGLFSEADDLDSTAATLIQVNVIGSGAGDDEEAQGWEKTETEDVDGEGVSGAATYAPMVEGWTSPAWASSSPNGGVADGLFGIAEEAEQMTDDEVRWIWRF